MNIVVLYGRLAKEPELRYTSNGLAVCFCTLAVDRIRKGGVDPEKAADFIPLKLFDKMAENFTKMHTKGSKALVSGRLLYDSWKDKDGNWHNKTEVAVDRFETVNSRDETLALRARHQGTQQGASPTPQQPQQPINGQMSGTYYPEPQQPQHDPQYEGFAEISDSDVPF